MPNPAHAANAAPTYEDPAILWKPFGSYEGFAYKILAVDVERRIVDMLFRFEPNRNCFYHRHTATVASFVLEGEHHLYEPDGRGGETHTVRGAGTFTVSEPGDLHLEGGGPQGGVVYFNLRGDSEHIYDILDDDLDLVREVSIHDFKKALDEW